MAVYWTDELNDEFRKQRFAKVPVKDMAAFFGTTVAAIYAHARVISALVQPHQGWTEDGIAKLRAGIAAGDTDKQLMDRTGRSLESVRWKLFDLELTGIRQSYWTEADYDRLRHLVDDGKTTAEMAEILGISVLVVRERLKKINLKARRPARPIVPRKAIRKARPPASPRIGEALLAPLDAEQLATLNSFLGTMPIRKIAKTMHMNERKLHLRAAAAGLKINEHMRRKGEPLTEDVIKNLVAKGLTATQAGKLVGRDRRTLAAAASSFGMAFATRADLEAKARLAKAGPKAAVRAEAARQAEARKRAAAHQVAARRVEAQTAAAAKAALASQDKDARAAAAKAVAGNTGVSQVVVSHVRAAKVMDAQAVANRVRPPAETTTAARKTVAVPRMAATAPKLVHISPVPATPRAATDVGGQAKPKRPFGWSFSPAKPQVVFDQREVDAAVARFIAERGVTRVEAADPAEATVTAARRLGFVVLRDGDGFKLDGRLRLASLEDLRAFVAKREEAKSQLNLAMTA